MTPEEWDAKFLQKMDRVLEKPSRIYQWLASLGGRIEFQRNAMQKMARIFIPGKVFTEMPSEDFEDWEDLLKAGAERVYRVYYNDPRVQKK